MESNETEIQLGLNANKHRLLVIAATLAFVSSIAHANPGTAMVMTVGIHLIIGNLIIGVIEWCGLLIFGASPGRSAMMIPANYFSAFVGMMLTSAIMPTIPIAVDAFIQNAARLAWVMLIIFGALGILIEYPFVRLAFKPEKRSFRRTTAAALCVNVVTVGLLALYYATVTNHALASGFKSVPAQELLNEYDGPTFSILSIQGNTVVEDWLDGSPPVERFNLPVPPANPDYYDPGYWLALLDTDNSPEMELVYIGYDAGGYDSESADASTSIWVIQGNGELYQIIAQDFAQVGSVWNDHMQLQSSPVSWGTFAAELRNEPNPDPVIRSQNSLPMHPLELIWKDGTREELALYNKAIGFSATPKCVTVLPGNFLIFMLGDFDSIESRGIYMLSLESRHITRLSDGRSPLVLMHDEPSDE